jgi:hypothetical protein
MPEQPQIRCSASHTRPAHVMPMTEREAGSQAAGFALRNRLLALRDDTLRRLVALDHIDGGLLRLLGDANLALAALDRQPSADAALAARAVVSDDGCEIRLTLYAQNGAAFAVPIAPGRAVALAGELIAAARPKLPQ